MVRKSLWRDVIPRAPMPKHPIKRCHLKKERVFYVQTAPLLTTPSGSKISGPTQRHCLLLLPTPPLAPAIAVTIAAPPLLPPRLAAALAVPPSPRYCHRRRHRRHHRHRHRHHGEGIFCLQGFKVLFQRRIYSTPTARKNQFIRSVGVQVLRLDLGSLDLAT